MPNFNYDTTTDLEIREQIALRLGYFVLKTAICGPNVFVWHTPEERGKYLTPFVFDAVPHGAEVVGELPHWTTDSGLAFAELWPKVIETNPYCQIRLYNGPCVDPGSGPGYYNGKTWAEAICRAFVSLPFLEEKR